jgi:hypothetical protein
MPKIRINFLCLDEYEDERTARRWTARKVKELRRLADMEEKEGKEARKAGKKTRQNNGAPPCGREG